MHSSVFDKCSESHNSYSMHTAVRDQNLHTATCHRESVLSATSSSDFPTFTPAEAGTRFSTTKGCKAESTWWWLHHKIIYPLKTVTYLRNNRAVSWLGIVPTSESHQSNVLNTTPQSHRHIGLYNTDELSANIQHCKYSNQYSFSA